MHSLSGREIPGRSRLVFESPAREDDVSVPAQGIDTQENLIPGEFRQPSNDLLKRQRRTCRVKKRKN
jgi:hypothetical protein